MATRRSTRSKTKPADLDPGLPPPTRKKRQPKGVVSSIARGPEQERRVLQSVEAQIVQEEPSSPHLREQEIDVTEDWDSDEAHVEKDPLQLYYERIGYLPPLDDATVEVLKFLKMSDPELDMQAGRVPPTSDAEFKEGLQLRMVDIRPRGRDNFRFKEREAQDVPEPLVPSNIKDYDGKLWERDMDKCETQIKEAIFQRTIMLSMIDRYHLFYGYQDEQSPLDFAVETPWTCPPMPTHAADRREKFLTCPRPDLAAGFRRESLFENCQWNSFPKATQRLVCYEGVTPPNKDRAFYFLTIEAKRGWVSVDDPVALNQCLNNASQALHNMFEFFKEADRTIGEDFNVERDDHTKKFFERVRFFSVVAIPGAMKIRIHRACRRSKTDELGPKSEYPLKFLFSNYKTFRDEDFTHQNVVKSLTEILHNYGVNELQGLLKEAISTMNEKFHGYRTRNHGRLLTRGPLFYSYNQGIPPTRGKSTSRASQTTPRPDDGRKDRHQSQSSALSQAQSISDDMGHLNVGPGASSGAGQANAGAENSQELHASQQEEVPDAGISGSPRKKRRLQDRN